MLKKSIKLLIAISLTVPFLITAKTEQLDKNITTKVDVKSFWNQLKRTREIKYGINEEWNRNIDYCSYWSEKVALSKGEELVVSNLMKYATKCMATLKQMTKTMYE